MAGIFDFLNGGNQNSKENEKFAKDAAKVQDFINKYKIRSRDLSVPKETATQEVYSPGMQSYAWIDDAISTTNNRATRYKEYREMTRVPELNQSLNIYADNATQYNVQNNVLEIQSNNNKTVEILEKLFFENLDLNANLWNIARNMCKLGDEFVEIVVDNPDNPKHIISLERIKAPENIKRIEKDGTLIAFRYEYDDDDKESKTFQPWQIVHFHIEDEEFDPYGKSVLEAGRKTFKKLSLMEDAMLVYRISRAPERRVFYIDVGTMPTKEANKFMETLKRQFRKKKFINPHCISLDTKIPLLDGREVELFKLIEEFNEGKENWVYSIDRNNKNKVIPGKIAWAGETRKNTKTLKLTLDNKQELIVTPDHNMILRTGEYCEAQNLKIGDSLMPLYRKISDNNQKIQGYEMVLDPSDNKYKYTHQISDFMKKNDIEEAKKRGQFVRHHVDMNKRNNRPDNISIMESKEHWKLHASLMSIRSKKLWADSVFKQKKSKELSDRNYKNWTRDEYRAFMSKTNSKAQKHLHEQNPNLSKEWRSNIDKYITDYVIDRRAATLKETLSHKKYTEQEIKNYSDSKIKFWNDNETLKSNYTVTMKKIGERYGSIGAKLSNRYKYLKPNCSYIEWKSSLSKSEIETILIGITDDELLSAAIVSNTKIEVSKLLDCSDGKVANKIKSLGFASWKEYKSTVNHKIVKIEEYENIDTGTLSIYDTHNFAVGSGIFIKNSGEVDEKANPLCITLDTKIPLLDGRSLTLNELIEEQNEGKENWVYSIDTENKNQIVPGKIIWADVTRKDAKLVKVVLDNGEELRTTPDHRFMLRDGSYCEAQDLKSGQALMPFYTQLSSKENKDKIDGYEKVYNPKTGKYTLTHQIVASNEQSELWKTFCKPNKQINGPNRHFILKALKENNYESSESWLKECDVTTKSNRYEYQNHKVAKVEWLEEKEDTGDITIEKYHNFATEAGVFVHNSVDEDFYIPVRQNSQGTRIETLPAGQNLGEIDDVKYFKDQILKTMGIPSGYLGGSTTDGGAGTYDPKSYLSNQEVQFARTIERVQKFIIKGLEKVAFVELILSHVEKDEIKDFKIKLTPPSNVDQLMEIEIRNQQFALIQQIRTLENFLPDEWIYTEILGMSEHDIQKTRLQLQMQQQMQLQMQALASSAGGSGMNMGGTGDAGGNIMGGPAPSGEAGGPPEAGPAPVEGGEGEAGLEVASQTVEFDGGKWLMENTKDVKKLLKYVKLYEKVHKDNKEDRIKYEQQNSATRMLIEGEFRGLVKAYRSSNNIILKEDKVLWGKVPRRKKSSKNTSK